MRLRHSADLGYAPAQCRLAICYASAQGVEQDFALALEWMQRSAAQNYEPAIDYMSKVSPA